MTLAKSLEVPRQPEDSGTQSLLAFARTELLALRGPSDATARSLAFAVLGMSGKFDVRDLARFEESFRDGFDVMIHSGFWKRKQKRLSVSAAYELGGIAASKKTTFWWKRKRGRGSGGSGPETDRFQNTGYNESRRLNEGLGSDRPGFRLGGSGGDGGGFQLWLLIP